VHKQAELIPFNKTETPLSPQDIKGLYEYVERRDEGEPGFRASITSMYERNARWSNPIIRLAVRSAALVLTPRNRSVKYFFWGTKFQEIILGLPRHEVCVIGGPKQLLFCLRHRIPFLANMQMWKLLALGLQHKACPEGDLKKLIEQSGIKLAKKAGHGASLIVDNDSLPMQRAFVLSGRLANLKSVCIQDGIFQSKSPGHIMHGWYADQFLAVNDHQKETLIAKGMKAEKIKVMGFHSSPYHPKRPTAVAGQRKVCFLGQPWVKYGHERAERYLKIVERAAMALHEAGIEMTYKPHPWERDSDHLNRIRNVVDITLNDALEKYDAFISLTSTALIEAQAAGRVAIQIMDDQFDADDLSVHGQIITIIASKNGSWHTQIVTALNTPTPPPISNSQPCIALIELLRQKSE
jgi:hypothetical protein